MSMAAAANNELRASQTPEKGRVHAAPPLVLERRFLRPKNGGKSREAAREALHASQTEFYRGVVREMMAESTATQEEQLEPPEEEGKPAVGAGAGAVLPQEAQVPVVPRQGTGAIGQEAQERKKPVVAQGGAFEERQDADQLNCKMLTSPGGRRSRRNASECNKKQTSPHAFKLRTEQRGKLKEQQLVHKMREMVVEEKKKRIHITQRLPWTTDEPQSLIKPAVRERTKPIGVVLHSDVRAIRRAKYDKYVLERNKFHEQQRLEWRRQQELEEEERIRQLRRTELIPKAQPLPYFDRGFIDNK